MSYKKSAFVAAVMGATLASTPALAGEFDGGHEFEYQVVGTAGTFCPAIKGRELPCKFVDVDLRLYGGEFTEDSVQGLAEEMIGDLEGQTGRDLPEEVEAQLHAAIAEAFAAYGDELNAALDLFPRKLQLVTPWYAENALSGSMIDSYGKAYPVLGSINLETGDYVLNSVFRGFFDRNESYKGRGSVEIPVVSSFEYGEILLDVEGSGFATYQSTPIAPDEPPPVDDKPDDEPGSDDPPTDSPVGDPAQRKALW